MAPFRIEALPGELRNIVYSNVPLSDKMTLLRTSRRINSEVSPLFYQEATFRILINVDYPLLYTAMPITRPPATHIKDNIHNLDIVWKLYGLQARKDADINALNWDPAIRRRGGKCRVFFAWSPEWNLSDPPSPLSFRDSDFAPLKTLAGFETVEIRVGSKALGRPHAHLAPERGSGYEYVAANFSFPLMRPMYEVLKEGLEEAFGVAELVQDPPEHFLRFRPWKNGEERGEES